MASRENQDSDPGTEEWVFKTENGVYASPTVVDGTVYVGSKDSNLYAVDGATGTEKWIFETGGRVYASPTVVDGTVYVGSKDNNLYAVDVATGTEEWTFETESKIYTSPTVVDGTVYVGSTDNNLYAVDRATGTKEWIFETGGGVNASPTVVDATVYVGSRDNNLYAVDRITGTEEWVFETASEEWSGSGVDASPTVVNGTVYVGSKDNNLYAVDVATGTEEWIFETGGEINASPTVVDGTVYVGSVDNNLYAITASAEPETHGSQPSKRAAVMNRSSISKGSFQGPSEKNNNKEDDKFVCDECGKEFNFESVLRKHTYSCDGDSEKQASRKGQSEDVHQSAITEYYEVIRALKRGLEIVEPGISTRQLTDPAAQYYKVLERFTNNNLKSDEMVDGYGPQHVDRVNHSVNDYREKYGNTDWITDYRVINIEPPEQEVRSQVTRKANDSTHIVRPCSPISGEPVPLFVETQSDLRQALALLAEFPARPSTGREKKVEAARYPVETIYQNVIDGSEAEPVAVEKKSHTELTDSISQDGITTSKEWDIDSLAKATTLDTEDIKDAINRLVDANHSHEKAIGYVRRYLTEMLQGDGLFAVYGVGPSSGSSLVEADITSTEELRTVTPQELSSRTELSTKQIQRLQEAAQAGNFSSLEPDNEQVAKQLLDSTKDPPTQNPESRHSQDITKRTGRDADQPKDSEVDSTPESLDNSNATTSPDGNNKQEILSPENLPVPDPEEYTVPGGGTIYPNYLSEYYEAFRDARKVLELVFQMSGTDIDPEDRRDPRIQYFVLLDACIGFDDVSTPFTGYGSQHQNRLSFGIRDYRKVFGDAETVTDYQVIDVKPFAEDTHELLEKKANVRTPREFVRPCIPGTNFPIPELPGSLAELQDALLQLSMFPAYPPLPSESGASNRTIPIADMYQTCFEDLDKDYRVNLTPLTTTESQPTGPVPDATPTSSTEAKSKLIDYGRLSHLFKRATPPAGSPVNRVLNVFALDWYRRSSPRFEAIQALAKHGNDDPIDTFRPRLQDLVHRRFLLDTWDYDYITVYPGHEAGSRSSQLVELAQDAVLDTNIIYTPLLERTETVERQREKSEEERQQVAFHPSKSLRTRAKLHDDTVILFDDICTTGSSLHAGTHLLRRAGADRVVCITLGLTPGGQWTEVKEVADPEATASEIIAGVDS